MFAADDAVVYGNSMDVFSAVETLQELGVQGRRIHVALTAPPCFADLEVEKAVMAALEKAEVQVHHNCLLAHMNQGEAELDRLTSASFSTGGGEPLHLQCGVSQSCRGPDQHVSAVREFVLLTGLSSNE